MGSLVRNLRPGYIRSAGAMRITRSRSVGAKESVYLLLQIRSRQPAYLLQLIQYSHELLSLCIGLRIQWRLSLMAKAQVIAKVTEVLSIEQRSIVTAYRHWYAQRGKSLIHLWYHCPGAGGGDKFEFRPSRLLAHRNQQVWIEPQKSAATSFQGSLGMGVMRNGSRSDDTLTTWHGW